MQISYIVLEFSSSLNDFGEKCNPLRNQQRRMYCVPLLVLHGQPQDASSQDSCKADTIVVPKHMQISMRRPLWRVITPYRYKGCVSCHSGDESAVVVVSCRSFFRLLSFSHSFSYVATRGLSFLRKIPQRTGCPRVIESPFRGSYSLWWFSYNPSVISLSLFPRRRLAVCKESLLKIPRRNTCRKTVGFILFRYVFFS